jgi:hypothetical protein
MDAPLWGHSHFLLCGEAVSYTMQTAQTLAQSSVQSCQTVHRPEARSSCVMLCRSGVMAGAVVSPSEDEDGDGRK